VKRAALFIFVLLFFFSYAFALPEAAKVRAQGIVDIKDNDLSLAFKSALSLALKSGVMKEIDSILSSSEKEEISAELKEIVENYQQYIVKYRILKMEIIPGEMEDMYKVEVEIEIDAPHLWEAIYSAFPSEEE